MDVKKELYYFSRDLATEQVVACYAIRFSRNGDEKSELIPTVTCIGPDRLRGEVSRRLWEIEKYVTLGVTPDDTLRNGVRILIAEHHRLLNEVNELRKQPAIPEAVVEAVFDYAAEVFYESVRDNVTYEHHRERIADVIAEALKRG